MSEKTLAEVKEEIRKTEPSMNELISIDDINQNVESWDNVDKDKLTDSIVMDMGDAWTFGINHPYGDTIRELAVSRFVDDMQRVPFNHLNRDRFQTPEDAVIEGYWLFNMSRSECEEIVWENMENIEFFHEYEHEIMGEIESAIIKARLDF
jgi:hypothetical protein